MKAAIVMPADAPRAKIAGTAALGAEIVHYDRVRDDREAIAAKICTERGATLVKPYDDPIVIDPAAAEVATAGKAAVVSATAHHA